MWAVCERDSAMLDTTKDDGFDLVRAQLSLDAPFPDIIYFWDVASWYIRYGTYLVLIEADRC